MQTSLKPNVLIKYRSVYHPGAYKNGYYMIT